APVRGHARVLQRPDRRAVWAARPADSLLMTAEPALIARAGVPAPPAVAPTARGEIATSAHLLVRNRVALGAGLVYLAFALMALASLGLASALSAALGAGLPNLILALVLTGWVSYCRIVRAEVLSLREREFVLAARVVGASGRRIVARHLVPNVLGPILVLAT